MNDDFLHRIRVEPPAGFMARLKARLDHQLPPASPAPRRSLLPSRAAATRSAPRRAERQRGWRRIARRLRAFY